MKRVNGTGYMKSILYISMGVGTVVLSFIIIFVSIFAMFDIGHYYSPKTYDYSIYQDGKWHTLRIYNDEKGEMGFITEPGNPDLTTRMGMQSYKSAGNALNLIYDVRTDSVYISSNVKDRVNHISGRYRYIEQTDSAFISRLTPDREEYTYWHIYYMPDGLFSGLEISKSDKSWWFEMVKPTPADSAETVEVNSPSMWGSGR